MSDPMIGMRVGLYHVVEKLGRGGVGAVYRCEHEDQPRALKIVRRDAPDYEAHRQRLLEEASLCMRARHPGLVRAYSTGEMDAGCYVIQELVAGRPLHHLLREETQPGQGWPLERIAEAGGQIAAALAHLHGLNIVHADLKPPNILVSANETAGAPPRYVICDLGLATASGTVRELVMGSPSYIAPEVARGQPITHAADTWSLGVILFELLTGARPFGLRTDDAAATVKAVKEAPLSTLLHQVPEGWRRLVETLLDRDASRRPADAAAVVRHLRGLR